MVAFNSLLKSWWAWLCHQDCWGINTEKQLRFIEAQTESVEVGTSKKQIQKICTWWKWKEIMRGCLSYSSITITKATYIRKHFTGGLMVIVRVGDLLHGRKHGSRQAGRHGSGVIVKSLHLDPQAGGRETKEGKKTGNGMEFCSLQTHPSDTPPPTRPRFLILP